MIDHHLTYRPPQTVKICEFCHWVIHRPFDVRSLIERIHERYIAAYGRLPIVLNKPRKERGEIKRGERMSSVTH